MAFSFLLFPCLSIWFAHIICEKAFLASIHITCFHHFSSFFSRIICEYFHPSPVLNSFISPCIVSYNPKTTHINFLVTMLRSFISFRLMFLFPPRVLIHAFIYANTDELGYNVLKGTEYFVSL
jgi:hypothetical protein